MDHKEEEGARKTLLIARATAQLLTGESFELLPFTDETDVKAKFSELVGDWAKSGFLLRGARIYPWHQVRQVHVTAVAEVPEHEARQLMRNWEIEELAEEQQSFWKSKKQAGQNQEKNGDKGKDQAH